MKRFTSHLVGLWLCLAAAANGQEFEKEPILYSESAPDNQVSHLIEKLRTGQAKLTRDEKFGYLQSLLQALEVPTTSQLLVFSKTSLQRNRISPNVPRAIYFNDDIYIGYCHEGDVLEISAADPLLGTVFWTLDQREESAHFTRQTDECLLCHGGSQTKEIPGHLLRSVYTDATGQPIFSAGTYRIDHSSPMAKRFGGWFVTGTHGEMKHLGNLIAPKDAKPESVDNSAGQNQTKLSHLVLPENYLTAHSDLVSHLVLAHQADAHNHLVRANFQTRQALFYQTSLNRELGKPADHVWESTASRIKSVCEPLVENLFFTEEAKLTSPVAGSSEFSREFASRGPRDSLGRSLRDFDLQTRLFKYPCSYLVYSDSFLKLPAEARKYVLRRMNEVLSSADKTEKFAHLSPADRAAILAILQETHPDWIGQGRAK